jgi:hypothetical protein
LAPLFDFLKRKDKSKDKHASPSTQEKESEDAIESGITTIPGENSLVNNLETLSTSNSGSDSQQEDIKDSKKITVAQVIEFLDSLERENMDDLSKALLPLKSSAEKSLKTMEKVADDLEREKIKLEETRFESIVENSRRTLVSSLKKEVSFELPVVESIEDAKKFEARLESMVNRLSGLSGSHSRVLNAFIKKYAGKLQGESKAISGLSKKSKSAIGKYEGSVESISETRKLLHALPEKVNSIENTKQGIENASNEIRKSEATIEDLTRELHKLEATLEFKKASKTDDDIKKLKIEEQEIHKELSDMFSRVNRAITKYSYGLPTNKELFMKLQTMANEPWQIFYQQRNSGGDNAGIERSITDYHKSNVNDAANKASDISSYVSILGEIRKALGGGKIELKDSDKVIIYLDSILEALPQTHAKISEINNKITRLREAKNREPYFQNYALVTDNVKHATAYLHEQRTSRMNLENNLREKKEELRQIMSRSEEQFSSIAGQKYRIVG